jgi:hypothetical protein
MAGSNSLSAFVVMYACIHNDTSIRQQLMERLCRYVRLHTPAYVSNSLSAAPLSSSTPAYASIRQHAGGVVTKNFVTRKKKCAGSWLKMLHNCCLCECKFVSSQTLPPSFCQAPHQSLTSAYVSLGYVSIGYVSIGYVSIGYVSIG